MKVVNRDVLFKLIECFPKGGLVFSECHPNILAKELMISRDDGSVILLSHVDDDYINFDRDMSVYTQKDKFMIYDINDIYEMIDILKSAYKENMETDVVKIISEMARNGE